MTDEELRAILGNLASAQIKTEQIGRDVRRYG